MQKLLFLAILAVPATGCTFLHFDPNGDMPYEVERVTVINRNPYFPIQVEKDGRFVLGKDNKPLTLKYQEGVVLSWENTTSCQKPAMVTITWKRGPAFPDRSIAARNLIGSGNRPADSWR